MPRSMSSRKETIAAATPITTALQGKFVILYGKYFKVMTHTVGYVISVRTEKSFLSVQ